MVMFKKGTSSILFAPGGVAMHGDCCCGDEPGAHNCCKFADEPLPHELPYPVTVDATITGTGGLTSFGATKTLIRQLTGSPCSQWSEGFGFLHPCVLNIHVGCDDDGFCALIDFNCQLFKDDIGGDVYGVIVPLTVLSCDQLHLIGESGTLTIEQELEDGACDFNDAAGVVCVGTGTLQIEVVE